VTDTRRAFDRQRVWPPVLARIGPASALEVLDLSEGGAGVLSSEPLTQGETIRLQIPLPRQEAAALTSGLAEATGETVWTAKSGRAGIRFLDVPVDSRLLLHEWIRQGVSAGRLSELEETRTPAPPAVPAPPAAQFPHPWIIFAAATVLGVVGGIWLAAREGQPEKKASVSTPLVQQVTKEPVSPAPFQDRTRGAAAEDSQVKPGEVESQEKASVPTESADQSSGAPISAAPVQAIATVAAPEVPKVAPPLDRPDSGGLPVLLPAVQAIRFSHQPGQTRVEIELGTSILLRHGRLHKPERIYFDVRDSHREKGIVRRLQEQKVGGVNDAVLTGVRVAPLRSGDVRVVLDLNRSCEYSHRLSPEPASSLIVELREPSAASDESPKSR
jgi:hypothetical protein